MDPEKLKEILAKHDKWARGEVGGERANLTRAYLTDANLTDANLTRAYLTDANLTDANLTDAYLTDANLTDANLTRAYLTDANLTDANLTRANLTRANLTRANLTRANLAGANLARANLARANLAGANLARANLADANMAGVKIGQTANITGEPWGEYLEKVVPALLTAGGKSLEEVVGSGCWNCHQWTNCPMAVAFGINDASKAPLLLRPRVEQFVQLFDAKLIPQPSIETSKGGAA